MVMIKNVFKIKLNIYYGLIKYTSYELIFLCVVTTNAILFPALPFFIAASPWPFCRVFLLGGAFRGNCFGELSMNYVVLARRF